MKKLTPEQKHILIDKGTEPAFSGELLHNEKTGEYKCPQCGNLLFKSKHKFDSGSGWPSFTEPATKDSIEYKEDTTLGMIRVEAVCKKCKGHLGHVFNDGPKKGKRFCVNSEALRFEGK